MTANGLGDPNGEDVMGPQGGRIPDSGVWLKLSGSENPEVFCSDTAGLVEIPE